MSGHDIAEILLKLVLNTNQSITCARVVLGTGYKAKQLVLQSINGVSSNTIEGEQKKCQLKNLIPTLLSSIFRHL